MIGGAIALYLRHELELYGFVATGAPLDPDGEDRGHPEAARTLLGTYAGLVQPRSARERASAAGVDANIGTHRIFLEAAALELPVDSDMELELASPASLAGTYRIRFVGDAAGQGHHAEIDADLVRA
jgi:hypothetical protein